MTWKKSFATHDVWASFLWWLQSQKLKLTCYPEEKTKEMVSKEQPQNSGCSQVTSACLGQCFLPSTSMEGSGPEGIGGSSVAKDVSLTRLWPQDFGKANYIPKIFSVLHIDLKLWSHLECLGYDLFPTPTQSSTACFFSGGFAPLGGWQMEDRGSRARKPVKPWPVWPQRCPENGRHCPMMIWCFPKGIRSIWMSRMTRLRKMPEQKKGGLGP